MVIFGLNSASVLAQVNLGTNSASILGIFLAVAGAGLYFLRTVRPELSRDQDIFFAAVGLLCGFILIFQGWRLDPILQFNQLLLVGSTVFFAVESIRLRGIATEQAKRNTPIVDKRKVSDDYDYRGGYDADLDSSLDPLPYEDEYDRRPRPRIQGSKDSRPSRDAYYEDEPPRRSERRNSRNERPETGDRTPKRRDSGRSPSRNSERIQEDDWGSSSRPPVDRPADDWDSSSNEERKPRRRPSSDSSRPEVRDEEVSSRPPRKRRPSADSSPRIERDDDDVIPTDYVDYKPIIDKSDRPEDNSDESRDFDDI
jgi:hypothetical protein